MFINNLGLSWSHPLRKNWRDLDKYRLDPAVQNSMRVTTLVAIFILIISLLSIFLGKVNFETHETLALIPMLLTMGSMMVTLLLGPSGFMFESFESGMSRLCNCLEVDKYKLKTFVWSELKSVATRSLCWHGNALLSVEYKHQQEPYHPDRLKAKKNFEDLYGFCLELKLIENVGYGKFIKSE